MEESCKVFHPEDVLGPLPPVSRCMEGVPSLSCGAPHRRLVTVLSTLRVHLSDAETQAPVCCCSRGLRTSQLCSGQHLELGSHTCALC